MVFDFSVLSQEQKGIDSYFGEDPQTRSDS